MAGNTGLGGNIEGVTCGNYAILWRFLRGNYQRMAIHAADILLDMEVIQVISHAFPMAVDTKIIGVLEKRFLAVRIMTIHAAHIGSGMAGFSPLTKGCGVTGTAIIGIRPGWHDLWGVVFCRCPMARLAGDPLRIIFTTGSNVIGCMAGQTGIRAAKPDPLLLEERIIIGIGMGASGPIIRHIKMAFSALHVR
jgi:hypothetical protein